MDCLTSHYQFTSRATYTRQQQSMVVFSSVLSPTITFKVLLISIPQSVTAFSFYLSAFVHLPTYASFFVPFSSAFLILSNHSGSLVQTNGICLWLHNNKINTQNPPVYVLKHCFVVSDSRGPSDARWPKCFKRRLYMSGKINMIIIHRLIDNNLGYGQIYVILNN